MGFRTLLLAIASVLCAAANAAPATIAECLKPWDLVWKLPYYPRYALADCRTANESDPSGGLYLSAPVRKTMLELHSDITWLLPAKFNPDLHHAYERAAQESALAHFEVLLKQQGFARVAGENWKEGSTTFSTSAVFAGKIRDAATRITVGVSSSGAQIAIEQAAQLKPQVQLPKPTRAYSLLEDGHYANLFALPGATFVDEKMAGGKVIHNIGPSYGSLSVPIPPIDRKTFIVPASPPKDDRGVYWVLARRFTYTFPKGVTVAQLVPVYLHALSNAGWKVYEGAHFKISVPQAFGIEGHFDLPDRRLYLQMNVSEDGGSAVVWADLFDPTFDAQILPVQQAMWNNRDVYVFTPTLAASGQPSPATQMQVGVLDYYFTQVKHTVQPPPRVGLVFTPALSSKVEGDSKALAASKEQTAWLAAEFKRRGWPESEMRFEEKPLVVEAQRPEFRSGVRVEQYRCFLDPTAGAPKTCVCRANGRLLSTTPGACT
jgi:hypothetical protein